MVSLLWLSRIVICDSEMILAKIVTGTIIISDAMSNWSVGQSFNNCIVTSYFYAQTLGNELGANLFMSSLYGDSWVSRNLLISFNHPQHITF